ncbi:extensin family protein [Fulvimarina sp. MAC8]|uniref:extensin-like domain-containing protein n=1 Tax=Fulvimarina sp. MAC8 TaxID=3162874 RepID=UPI0032F0865F
MVLRIRVGGGSWRAAALVVVGLSAPSMAQANGNLVWGGNIPAPDEAYRPSPSAVDMFGTNATAPAQSPKSVPQPSAVDSLANDLIPRNVPAPTENTLLPVAQPSPDLAPSPAPTPMRDADTLFGGTMLPELPRQDPWAAMKAVTPGALTDADRKRIQQSAPPRATSYAALEKRPAPKLEEPVKQRAPLVHKTPSGWRNLPKKEALCRAALVQLGVEFTEPAPIRASKSCGVPYPVKVTRIAKGVAMSPAATLNCDAAFRISRWVDKEVKRAAHSTLGTRVAAIKNSSSYRCSRVAGSGGISQHASGNALDVAAFVMADGTEIDVEKKGIFSPREKAFQNDVRGSGCRWFGTVLGPGYDYLHRNHFHLDARERKKTYCK